MKLAARSVLVLLALYGLVFAIGDAYLASDGAPLWLAVLFALGVVALQFAVGPRLIEWLMSISWDDDKSCLPARNREFLERLCAERGLKMPRIGIIHSDTPNAFTFGHVRWNARVVVSSGLYETLTPEETNAVLAHEMGHVEHWDFVVMTVAAVVPLILYQIYAFGRRRRDGWAIAIGAYLCYLVSEFLVLLLSRTREYAADEYSATVTGHADNLATGLVKIAYGMVRADGQIGQALQHADAEEKSRLQGERHRMGSLALMGISNIRSGAALALSASPAAAAGVMRWDLVNPWAKVYELSSTHPLTALRIRALNRISEAKSQPIQYPLPEDRQIRWNGFATEFLMWIAPWISTGLFAAAMLGWFADVAPEWTRLGPLFLMLAGMTWLLRIAYRYAGSFHSSDVETLLQDVEVSQMRPRAVRLEGEILGRGVPGVFWCPDLVLADATGRIYMLYRSSIPLARLFFALSEAEQYVGQKVVVEGWFRRGLSPYVEMSCLTDAQGKTHRSYSRWIQSGVASVAVIAGGYWWLLS
jgi:heat shock protein HtpX